MVDYWNLLVLRLQAILAQLPTPIELPDPRTNVLGVAQTLERTYALLTEEDGPLTVMLGQRENRELRRVVIWLLDSQNKILKHMQLLRKGGEPLAWETESLRLSLRRAHAYLDEIEKKRPE